MTAYVYYLDYCTEKILNSIFPCLNKEIYIQVASKSVISTKGFISDLSNKEIKESSLTLVINTQYDSTYAIFLHKGKGYAYFNIL